MPDGPSLISLGELTKPATVLIEKIADAIGGVAAPYQMVRVARAEVEVEKIKAEARADIEQRALDRVVREETRRQRNIDEIMRLALPQVEDTAEPASVDDDWIANFFDKCRLTSDQDMQLLWSRILAGEANAPGRFSKRTVNLVATFSKTEAEQFTALCGTCWKLGDELDDRVPLVFDETETTYEKQGVTFDSVAHLASIGLVRYESDGFWQFESARQPVYWYFGRSVRLTLRQRDRGGDYSISIGRVMLTRAGLELAQIAGAQPSDAHFDYVVSKWRGERYFPVVVSGGDGDAG